MTDTTVRFEYGGCRVQDIAYTAFMMARQPNDEDGGPTDWFNDTWPAIKPLIAAQPSDGAQPTRDQVLGVVRRYAAPAWCSVDRLTDEIVTLYATPSQPDTGDVAALREVTNMDRVREFHETFGVPVLPSPCIPADRVKMRLEILDEERRELDEALEADDLIEVADALTDMAYLIYGTALEFGIDLNACFAEVHRSNMSKLGADGKPIYREDGKVLKGPSYSPPDLRAALSKPNAPGAA